MTIKVFLVEDSPTIRASLTEALEEMAPVRVVGFAEDESTANEWLAANDAQCDLLVIDIFLKRGSGLGVLQAARRMRQLEKVVLSNFASEDIRRKCLELGARHVFDKSNEIEDLVDYCVRLDSRGPL